MENTTTCPRLNARFIFRWEESQGAYILLYPEGLIKLNASAGEILKRCDGKHCEDEIVDDLVLVFPGDREAIARGTAGFLAVAREKGWLQN